MVRQIVSLLIGHRKPVVNNLNDPSNIDRLEVLTGKIIASKSPPKGTPPAFYDINERGRSQGESVKV